MKLSAIRRLFDKLWNRTYRQERLHRRSPQGRNSLRLTLETLEDRTVMTTLTPAALVSEQVALAGGLAPQMVVDPYDPQRLVAVATTGTSLVGLYTEDGGDSWSNFSIAGRYSDPTLMNNGPALLYAAESDPSVSFDLLGNFYISSIQHDGSYGSGSVALHKFRWDVDAAPVQIQQAPDIVDRLYQWVDQDRAYNTFVAVDTNLIEYTDPTSNTPVALDDTMTTHLTLPGDVTATEYPKAVYVAWNVDHTGATSRVMAAASQDGGASFTTMVRISDGNGTDPQILFTQGSQDGQVPGGQMVVFYNTTGGGINMDVTRPDGGNPDAPVASRASYFFQENGAILDSGPGGSNIPDAAATTTFTRTININEPNLSGADTITDVDIVLNITHFDLRQVSITITPPAATGVGPITLLRNRIRGFNNADQDLGRGITALSQFLGVIRDQVPNVYTIYREAGTVFDHEAPRNLSGGTNSGNYISHYQPEYPSIFSPMLSDLYGLTAAQLSGDWTISITDHRDTTRPNPDPNPPDRLLSWELRFSGLIDNDGFGSDQAVASGTAGSATNVYGNTPPAAPTSGVGTMFSVVQDKTVGLDSPYQGRVYVAYTSGSGTDTNVSLVHIDRIFTNLPNVWSAPVRINNDSLTDNFSEGNRSQFMPTLAVDSATGTLVVTYYDARFDAANARVVTMITTSTDGGETFLNPVYLNTTKTAINFLTGETIDLGPVPGNQGAAGTLGFGDRQALYAYQGRVIPLFASNENSGGSSLFTAQVTVAAGPTVVSGDMGIILQPASVIDDQGNIHYYNHTYDADGVRQLTGFVVAFDRPIDLSTFTVDDVEIHFRDPFTPANLPATEILAAGQVIALDSNTDFGSREIGGADDPGRFATRFLVLLDTPQSRIGTYSYAIGSMISDNMRDPYGRILPDLVASQEPAPGQQNLPIPGAGIVTSDIIVTAGANGVPTDPAERLLRDLTVEVDLTTADTRLITIELIAPGGITVMLHNGGGPQGGAFAGTLFDDAAPTPIGDGNPPYTTRFRPDGRLLDILEGINDVQGTWRLRVSSLGGAGTLVSWRLNMQLGEAENYTPNQTAFEGGNWMDQNPDAIGADGLRENPTRRLQGDRFAVPDPVSGVPFQLPYTVHSLPLHIPGAHLIQAANEVQTLTIVATGGTFTLTFDGETTGNLARNISGANLRAALEGLSTIGTGNVEVVRNNNVYTITFRNGLGNRDVAALIADGTNLTGTTPSATVATIMRGSAGARVTGLELVNGESLVVNGTASSVDVEFDRAIAVATFTAADVLQIIGPYGPIAGPFTVTAVNPVGGFARIFRITFAQQTQPGSYTIHLGSGIVDRQGNGVDNNLNAGLAVLAGTDPTNANFALNTYVTGSVNVAIPANQTVLVPLDVPDGFLIQQNAANHIQFLFNLQHNNVPDLRIELVAPDGTTVLLADLIGIFGPPPNANFQNVTLDDFAATALQEGAPPFNAGPYKPQTPLSVLAGKFSLGTWNLRITNTGGTAGVLENWQLRLPRIVAGTGLGEPIADRTAVGFRIFIGDPSNVVSTTQWSQIGPQTNDDGFTGRVGAIAVDPSDPSGNTVYAGGANGGIWKTHNFLTTDPQGPTWVPLTDLGPTMAMNIGHIAIQGRNNDPSQSIIIVSTGDNGEFAWPGGPQVLQAANRYPGVGFMISFNGGASWTILDSTSNADINTGVFHNINSGLRDRTFVGAKVNKVVFDPTPLSSGEYVVYAAVTGTGANAAAQQGIWRSLDTGRTWTRIRSGNATDVVLSAGSAGSGGQLTILYAAFQGEGVYITNSALNASTMTLLAGNGQSPERRDFDPTGTVNPPVIPFTNPANNPGGNKGRILLAAPTLTNQPLQDTFYQGWLYALVIAADGSFDGLYLTKDFGRNWTDIRIPFFLVGREGYPTNNETRAEIDLFDTDPREEVIGVTGMGNLISSLTIDPNDPNIVYLGGYLRHLYSDAGANPDLGFLEYTEAFIRVDATTLSDPYAVVAHDNSDADGGTTQAASEGPTSVKAGLADYGILNQFDLDADPRGGYFNLMRHPDNPFLTVSTQLFTNVDNFRNEGTDVKWSPFNYFWTGSVPPDTVYAGWFGHGKVVAVTDQVTGKTRLVVGSGDGVFTAVDDGSGGHLDAIGTTSYVNGSRTGNLQFTQFTAGAIQPSFVAADIANSVFYGMAVHLSITQTSDTILQDGGIGWDSIIGGGEYVAVDPTGSGQTYQFRFPRGINQFPFAPTDFFIITPPGVPPTSRITGLLQVGDDPGNDLGQWPALDGSVFAVSPIDNRSIVIGSADGRLFRTTGPLTGGGIQWFVVAQPANLDTTPVQALAFGAPSSYPAANPADVIYAGTELGGVYATFTGGGFNGSPNWKPLGSPDGTTIMKLIANPTANSRELYAVTREGVYFMADTSAGAPVWQNITGNLFTLTRGLFNNPADPIQGLIADSLTDLVADWRFAIPDDPFNPTGPSHPVLYVSAHGGVFRSIDKGTTWAYFPGAAQGADQEGGWLPNIEVRQLALGIGDINPNSGFPDQSSGLNILAAFTYGRGAYFIRLDNSDVDDFLVVPNSGPQVVSIEAVNPQPEDNLTGIQVTFAGPVDPVTFSPADVLFVTDPNGDPVNIASVVDVTPAPAPGQANQHNVYQVLFDTAYVIEGTYTIRLGTDIRDFSGNEMNQDGDTTNGEVPEDEFQGTIDFFFNQTPTLDPLPDRTISHNVPDLQVTLNAADGDGDTLTFSVMFSQYTQLFDLDTQFGFFRDQVNVPDGSQGLNERWFVSQVNGMTYGLLPNGELRQFNQTNLLTSPLIATLPTFVHADPTLLSDAVVPPNPNTAPIVVGSFLGNILTVDPPANFQGIFRVEVTADDGNGGMATRSFLVNVTNLAPTLAPIPDQTMSHTQDTLDVALVTNDGDGDTLTFDVTFDPYTLLFDLDQQFQFFRNLSMAPDNAHGQGEKWVLSAVDGGFYAILPNGQLKRFNNHQLATSPVIANLTLLAHADPTLLSNAAVPPTPAALATVNWSEAGGILTIDPPAVFGGLFVVNVTATDGIADAVQSFVVSVTNQAPTLAPIPDQTMPHTQPNITIPLTTSDPDGDPLTINVAFAGYSQLFDLDQQFQFFRNLTMAPDNAHGQGEKWVLSAVDGGFYAILPNGQLKKFNNHQLATSPVIANLPTFVHTNPSLLSDAVPPPDTSPITASVAGTNLTLNPPPNFAGIVQVTVQSTDGFASAFQTFLLNVVNQTPTLGPIADQTMPHTQDTITIPLALNDPEGDPITVNVAFAGYSQLFDLDQQFQFFRNLTMAPDNAHGQGEKWVLSAVDGGFYAILPNGQLKKFNNHQLATSPVIATLPTFVHTDPSLLADAVPPPDTSPITAGRVGNNLILNPPANFGGIVQVTVQATDGATSAFRTFLLNVVNKAPVLAPIPDQTMSHTQNTLVVNLSATEPEGDPVTFSATFAKYTQLFDLDTQFGFFRNLTMAPDNAHGQGEKWVLSAVDGGFYAILPNGQLKKFNNHQLATSPVIATLPTFVHTDPSLLADALVPPNPTVSSSIVGNVLTIDPPFLFAGILEVTVQATDGANSSSRTFLLNVTNQVPTLAPIADQSMSHTQDTLSVPLNFGDADADPLSITAAFSSFNQLFNLDQQFQFFRNLTQAPDNAHGKVEKWVLSAVDGGFYAILPNGQLKKFNNHMLDTSPVVANLPTLVHTDPSLLADAVVPPNPNAPGNNVQVGLSGNNLVINPPANFIGLFTTTVQVTDGIASAFRTFLVNVGNQPPAITAIPNQTMAFNQDTLTVNLSATDPDGDAVTFSAQASANSLAVQLDTQFGFFSLYAEYRINFYGEQEKWIRSAVNGNHYAIKPNGNLHRITSDPANPFGELVATLPLAFYDDPSLLWFAQESGQPTIGVQVIGNQLILDPPPNFLGTITVTVFASDGKATSQRSFTVTVG